MYAVLFGTLRCAQGTRRAADDGCRGHADVLVLNLLLFLIALPAAHALALTLTLLLTKALGLAGAQRLHSRRMCRCSLLCQHLSFARIARKRGR